MRAPRRPRAWFRVLMVVLFTALLSGGAGLLGTGARADTPPISGVTWLAAGDSYSSGEGIAGTGESPADPCARSDLAFGPRAADILRRTQNWSIATTAFVACTGAVMHEFFSGDGTDAGAHRTQWGTGGQAQGRFDVVTMSFGGNDIGFPDVMNGCFWNTLPNWLHAVGTSGTTARCGVDFDSTPDPVRSIQPRIDELANGISYAELAKAQPSTSWGSSRSTVNLPQFYADVVRTTVSTRGTLVVVGYPRLFAPSSEWARWHGNVCSGVTAHDADQLGLASKELDRRIRIAVDQANALLGSKRIEYVSRFDLFQQGGSHELCSGQVEYINGIPIVLEDGSLRKEHAFHPNVIGHQVTAEAVAGEVSAYFTAQAAPSPTTAEAGASVTTTPSAVGDGTSHWNVGDPVRLKCYVAWPTGPTFTTRSIEMTMSCGGVPAQFTFVKVTYGDPNLPITPSTGEVTVVGQITDYATNSFGFRELLVTASSITW